MQPRYFTIREAEALLPELEQKVTELRRVYNEARELYDEVEEMRRRGYRRSGNVIHLYDEETAETELEDVVEAANQLIQEIHAMGCHLKDIEMGLVDFPTVLDGEEALLCWRLGEKSIQYYHPADKGFSSRRPLWRASHES